MKEFIADVRSKKEIVRDRRKSIPYVEPFTYERKNSPKNEPKSTFRHDDSDEENQQVDAEIFRLPEIQDKHKEIYKSLVKEYQLVEQTKEEKKLQEKYIRRPQSKALVKDGSSVSMRKVFKSLPRINKHTIDSIVDYQEEKNACRDLSKRLELYSKVPIDDVDGFKREQMVELTKRKKVIQKFKDPAFIPNYKYIDNSKMLQLAFLDKIIEECDLDRANNKISTICEKTHEFINEQQKKIIEDDQLVEAQDDLEGFKL